jgi:hypothetical protein
MQHALLWEKRERRKWIESQRSHNQVLDKVARAEGEGGGAGGRGKEVGRRDGDGFGRGEEMKMQRLVGGGDASKMGREGGSSSRCRGGGVDEVQQQQQQQLRGAEAVAGGAGGAGKGGQGRRKQGGGDELGDELPEHWSAHVDQGRGLVYYFNCVISILIY